jgi:hypothetical protein
MLENNEFKSGVAIFLAVVAATGLKRWQNSYLCEITNRSIKYSQLHGDCLWLDQTSFDVLTAICDTIVPSYNSDLDCSRSLLEEELLKISPIISTKCVLTIDNLMRNKEVLLRGAVESRTHILVADALQTFSHKFDQQQLYILLRLLGTSIGCFLLTGIPVPFQVCQKQSYHQVDPDYVTDIASEISRSGNGQIARFSSP